jgi:hypothetical protein
MDERGGTMMEAAKGMPNPAAVKEAEPEFLNL